ncbi:restriction endonuclease [Laribacter hongkongensis]|uniref:restriction endonuclease n=1 Tax=Laribacter hongkongensis TaxID=168471 RepID=UPI001EFED810|nr:restriction endonuclease [Laribacter hongkongensis]MCG9053522.1 restriction endonuclease [Laribacter hongkongensis]
MGEAKKRGNRELRVTEAIKRNKNAFVRAIGVVDDNDPVRHMLQAGLKPFMDRMTKEQWQARRARLLDALRAHPANTTKLTEAQSVRVREDEMGWYLFLCEQELEDPMCNDSSQALRILPFFAGLGCRWQYAHRVAGIEKKLDALLKDYRKEPDGLLFELLVALSYAAEGWDVEFIDEGQRKTADLRVTRDEREFYVECKRMARTTDYSVKERNAFLRLWDAGKSVLFNNGQWIWFNGTFHVEPTDLQEGFLRNLWRASLPISEGEHVLLNNEQAIIRARLINQERVHQHLSKFRVKAHSPAFVQLLGEDWAPDDASVTLLNKISISHVAGCEAQVLGTYVEQVAFACGFTREFDSEPSINKKAKDVIKLLSDAVKQLPEDKPSIIHVAAETMEGAEVERRRSEKVQASVPAFYLGKPVALIRLHRFQAHQRATMSFELDEAIDDFQMPYYDLENIPATVVVPPGGRPKCGGHWDLNLNGTNEKDLGLYD